MALPIQVRSGIGIMGHHPPMKSSAGAFYCVVRSGSTTIDVFKATDPTDTWTQSDASGRPFLPATMVGYSIVQGGDLIHIVAWTNSLYEYSQFNMATDNWDVGGGGETIDVVTDNAALFWASIAVRSDGDVIVAYNGSTDQNMGGTKERADYAIRNGTWSAGIALDPGGDIHYGNPACVLGTNDGVHILFTRTTITADDPPTTWQHVDARTLDSGDTLQSVVETTGVSPSSSLLGMQNMVSYDDAGTQRITVCGTATGSDNRWNNNLIEDGSDNAALNDDFFSTGTPGPRTNGEVGIITIAELDADLYELFSGGGSGGVDADIYLIKSTTDGTTWDAPTEVLDGITCNFISGNIYTRGADTVFAYVYDDDGVQKYNEEVLIAGAVGLIEPPLIRSFAIIRSTNY